MKVYFSWGASCIQCAKRPLNKIKLSICFTSKKLILSFVYDAVNP